MKQEIRKITITGGTTYYITIPKWMIEKLRWRKGQKVVVNLKGKKIEVEDWKKK